MDTIIAILIFWAIAGLSIRAIIYSFSAFSAVVYEVKEKTSFIPLEMKEKFFYGPFFWAVSLLRGLDSVWEMVMFAWERANSPFR